MRNLPEVNLVNNKHELNGRFVSNETINTIYLQQFKPTFPQNVQTNIGLLDTIYYYFKRIITFNILHAFADTNIN